MLGEERKTYTHIEQLCCLDPSMSGNDLVIVIDQNGVIEAEPLDAARDLPDLLNFRF